MPSLSTLPTVQLKSTWAGTRILDALKATVLVMYTDIIITCGCEDHPASDPHTLGEAFDIRTHTFTEEQKPRILAEIMRQLQQKGNLKDAPIPTSDGLATMSFFGWIENPGRPDEHIHIQRRKGTVYTAAQYLAA